MQHQNIYLQIYWNSTKNSPLSGLTCLRGEERDPFPPNRFHCSYAEHYAITTEQTDYTLYFIFKKQIVNSFRNQNTESKHFGVHFNAASYYSREFTS